MISYHIISSSLSLLLLVGLLDPRWREQQNKTVDEKKQQDEIFAVGMYTHNMYKFNVLIVSKLMSTISGLLHEYLTVLLGYVDVLVWQMLGPYPGLPND